VSEQAPGLGRDLAHLHTAGGSILVNAHAKLRRGVVYQQPDAAKVAAYGALNGGRLKKGLGSSAGKQKQNGNYEGPQAG